MLQKPSPKSKAKQHLCTLERRLKSWIDSGIEDLIREVKQIQSNFIKSRSQPKGTENLPKLFAKYMMEGKVSAAMKLLDSTSSSGVLPLTDEVMKQLKQKHPDAACILGYPLLVLFRP